MIKFKILMLDTDKSVLEQFYGLFSSVGYDFTPLSDPCLFLDTIKKYNPDIILMEVSLGKFKGENILKLFRRNGLKTPIIVVSSRIDKLLVTDLKEFGVNAYLTKPVDLKKAFKTIHALLNPAATGIATSLNTAGSKPMSLLIITENEAISEDPSQMVPKEIIDSYPLTIYTKANFQDSTEILKRDQYNFKVIIVDAAKETTVISMSRLLKIIKARMNLPIFFFSDEMSNTLMVQLKKMGFEHFINNADVSTKKTIINYKIALEEITGVTRKSSKKVINVTKELSNLKSLPPIPAIFNKIEALSKDEDSTSDDYAAVLELDPGITARLLRISNSSFYSLKRKIQSVKDTVTLLGSREILSLVRIACLSGNLNTNPDVSAVVRKVWEHSAACALTAKMLYEKTDIAQTKELEDEFFIAGIIHDLGKIILWNYFADIYMSFVLNPAVGKNHTVDEEKAIMGASHIDIGKAISDLWNLPDELKDAIAFHHNPEMRIDSDIVIITHLSDIITDIVIGEKPKDQVPKFSPEVLEKIGKTEQDMLDWTNENKSEIQKNIQTVIKMITE